MDREELFTAVALAARWNVSRATINRWQRVGLLRPAGTRGLGPLSGYLYSLGEVERFEGTPEFLAKK